MASKQQQLPTRERRPSMGAPIVDIQGAVGPAGISRPKHTRTATGYGPSEIKGVEGMSLFIIRPGPASPGFESNWDHPIDSYMICPS